MFLIAPATSLYQDKQLANIWHFFPATDLLKMNLVFTQPWLSKGACWHVIPEGSGSSGKVACSRLGRHQSSCIGSAQGWEQSTSRESSACAQPLRDRCEDRNLVRALCSTAECSFPLRQAASPWGNLSASFLLVLLHCGTAGPYSCMRTSCSPESLCVTLLGLYIFYYVWLLVRVRWKLFPDYNKATSNIISVVRSLTILK